MTVWLWPLPLIALLVYVWRQTVLYRRESRTDREAFEEHVAQIALGYERRPDHPWSHPFNSTRPSGFQAVDGACGEHRFDCGNLTG